MVFKFAYFMELAKDYKPAKFQCYTLSESSFTQGLQNTMMTSLRRHFMLLEFEVSIFCETDYKLSTCQVSSPSAI